MAAGMGSRLEDISRGQPKCLIKAREESLIGRIVQLCKSQGIEDISIVTGFKSLSIQEEIGNQVTYFHNPFFEVTNSISSLWFAREKLVENTLLMNADLFFEEIILNQIINQKKDVVMLSDSSKIESADYRFGFKGDKIIKFGKTLSNKETDGEYVGIVRISKIFIKKFKSRLMDLISIGRINDWWEDVLYSFIPDGLPINHLDIAGNFWTEIDNHTDYTRLEDWLNDIEPKKDPMTSSTVEVFYEYEAQNALGNKNKE